MSVSVKLRSSLVVDSLTFFLTSSLSSSLFEILTGCTGNKDGSIFLTFFFDVLLSCFFLVDDEEEEDDDDDDDDDEPDESEEDDSSLDDDELDEPDEDESLLDDAEDNEFSLSDELKFPLLVCLIDDKLTEFLHVKSSI